MRKGTREPTKGGEEYDMASRKARRIVGGRFKWVKQKFWQRIRKSYRLSMVAEARSRNTPEELMPHELE